MANPNKGPDKQNWSNYPRLIGYGAMLLFLALVFNSLWNPCEGQKTVPYSQFQTWLSNGEVSDLTVGQTSISGTYKPAKGSAQKFTTDRVDPAIAEQLDRHHVSYAGQPPPGVLFNLLSWLAPVVILVLLWRYFLFSNVGGMRGGGLLPVGQSRAKVYAEKGIKTSFADVAGVDEAKQELAEVVDFLKNPTYYGRLGARVPKGVLLVGPPGTGKTLLARAVAGEANVPFLSITGSEFVEMFVGVGAARVRDLFEQARKQAPAIIFIDELDALGRARGVEGAFGGGHDEKEQTLNQLLAEMDGFDPRSGVIILAATNRPEILDPALLRAGRFDRQVLVDRPDRKGRVEILRVHLKKIQAAPDLEVDTIAGLTTGFTGADLANLVNEAALSATRRDAKFVALDDFQKAVERIVAGLEKKSRILNPKERDTVAHHEMGHALVAMSLPGTDPVQKISIIPHGMGALGFTMQRPVEDRYLIRQSELENRLAVLLGGRAAEALVYGEISTGAADDLVRATDIARDMVVRFGMVKDLGPVSLEPERGGFLIGQTPVWRPKTYGEHTAEAIDVAVRELLEAGFRKATAILEANRALLEAGARELLEHETLGPKELENFAGRLVPPAPKLVALN
jgi:cell division protease FtsH